MGLVVVDVEPVVADPEVVNVFVFPLDHQDIALGHLVGEHDLGRPVVEGYLTHALSVEVAGNAVEQDIRVDAVRVDIAHLAELSLPIIEDAGDFHRAHGIALVGELRVPHDPHGIVGRAVVAATVAEADIDVAVPDAVRIVAT